MLTDNPEIGEEVWVNPRRPEHSLSTGEDAIAAPMMLCIDSARGAMHVARELRGRGHAAGFGITRGYDVVSLPDRVQ